MQVRHTTKTKRLDTERAVQWVVLEPPLCEQLDETPQKILEAFQEILKNCRPLRTNQIAKQADKSNETSVRKHLQALVSSDYIRAYF